MYRKLKNFFTDNCKYPTPKVTSSYFTTQTQITINMSAIATSATTSVNTYNAAEAKAFRAQLKSRTADDWCEEGVSFCIPRVFNNISYKRIFTVFKNLRWGYLERVDTIRVQPKDASKKPYKRAYIHFTAGRFNKRNPEAMAALEHMIAGNDVQLEYEDGKQWYWLVSLSHARKPDEAPKPPKPANVTLAAPRTQRRKVLDLSSETSSEIKVGNDPILARAFSNRRRRMRRRTKSRRRARRMTDSRTQQLWNCPAAACSQVTNLIKLM